MTGDVPSGPRSRSGDPGGGGVAGGDAVEHGRRPWAPGAWPWWWWSPSAPLRCLGAVATGAHRLETDQQEDHPEEQQHHHHGAQGADREEPGTRSFIGVTVTRTGPGSPAVTDQGTRKPSRRPGLLPAGPQPTQAASDEHRGGQRLGPVDQCVENLVVVGWPTSRRAPMASSLAPAWPSPLPFERQDVVLTAAQPVRECLASSIARSAHAQRRPSDRGPFSTMANHIPVVRASFNHGRAVWDRSRPRASAHFASLHGGPTYRDPGDPVST